MSRLIILGATGSLGSHVLRMALAVGHKVTVFVRTPSKLPLETRAQVSLHQGDLSTIATMDLAQLIRGHDALINCAGLVTEGQTFVDLIDRIVTSVESLPKAERPVCWFLAGAALLDINHSGRNGIGLPKIKSTFWPHQVNFERISRTDLDWRILCPGPMVEGPALSQKKLRISLDTLPVHVPAITRILPSPLFLPIFAYLIPYMIVPYANAAALMLGNLNRDNSFSRHRVGVALPPGMRGKKSQWATKSQKVA